MNNYLLYWFIAIVSFILFFKMTKKYSNKQNNMISEFDNPLLLPEYQQQIPNINTNTKQLEMPQLDMKYVEQNFNRQQTNASQFDYPVLDGINNDYKNTLLKMKSWY